MLHGIYINKFTIWPRESVLECRSSDELRPPPQEKLIDRMTSLAINITGIMWSQEKCRWIICWAPVGCQILRYSLPSLYSSFCRAAREGWNAWPCDFMVALLINIIEHYLHKKIPDVSSHDTVKPTFNIFDRNGKNVIFTNQTDWLEKEKQVYDCCAGLVLYFTMLRALI